MKILKVFGFIIGLIVIAFLILYFLGPSNIYLERSIVVNAPVGQVYNELNSVKKQNNWSPWAERDPHMENTYEGPEEGIGSKVSWKSDSSDVGTGSMWIVESQKNEMIKTQMDFGFPGEQYARFKLSPADNGTKVTWTYEEEPKSYSKAFYAVVDIEDMLAPDYEKGLANFKTYIEAKAKINPENVGMEEEISPQ